MDMSTAVSGIVVGAAFGFVVQRGRFCLNTAFRNALSIQEFTHLRAYVLALVIALIGSNLLEQFGLLHLGGARQEFAWLANIIGGYVFGVGMVLAGGDASGAWSRMGEGIAGSWMAALGFMIGAAAAEYGALSGIYHYLHRFVLSSGNPLTIHGILGVNVWIVVVLVSIAGLAFVMTGKKTHSPMQTGYSWRTGGFLIGLIVVLGLFLSERAAGSATGISFPGPSSGLLAFMTSSKKWDWGVSMVLGVPIGSFLSASGLHEFSWRAPRADVMIQQFSGGLIMGAGGMLAGGCAVGHGITGMAALSLASLVSMAGIIMGCWTMVYLLFMRKTSVK